MVGVAHNVYKEYHMSVIQLVTFAVFFFIKIQNICCFK